MAQLGGVLAEASMRQQGHEDLHALLSMADRVRFRRPVCPGDRVEYRVTMKRVGEAGARMDATAYLGDDVVAEAQLTYVFIKVTHPVLIARRKEYLDIWLHGGLG